MLTNFLNKATSRTNRDHARAIDIETIKKRHIQKRKKEEDRFKHLLESKKKKQPRYPTIRKKLLQLPLKRKQKTTNDETEPGAKQMPTKRRKCAKTQQKEPQQIETQQSTLFKGRIQVEDDTVVLPTTLATSVGQW